MSPLTHQGTPRPDSPLRVSPEKSPPRVTFNEKDIKAQEVAAAQRKGALRVPGEGAALVQAGQEAPKGAGKNQTPKGGGFWKRKRERWKKKKGKGKGKGVSHQDTTTPAVEARRVEVR